MTSAKQVILAAIHNKGTATVRAEAGQFADDVLCSKAYVMSIVRKVEKEQILIKQG